jgi:hypothetical protein
MADPRSRSGASRELLRERSEALREIIEQELLASYKRGFVNASKTRGKAAAANGAAIKPQPDDDRPR